MAKSVNHTLSASTLDCLGMVESNISILYAALAERLPQAEAQTLFRNISGDGQRHSELLKDACEQLTKLKPHSSSNDKLEDIFNVTYTIYKDIIAKEEAEEQLAPEELLAVANKMFVLEKSLCEKYALAQARTLKVLGRDTFLKQHASLDSFGCLFERLIDDSEQHQKILASVMSNMETEASQRTGFSVETTFLPAAVPAVKPFLVAVNAPSSR